MYIPFKSRKMRWTGPCGTFGGEKKFIQDFVGKSEGKRLLERPRSRWENNIKMHHTEVVYEGVDWTHLVQDGDRCRTLVNIVINLRVSQNARKFLTS
jgi:hypothetical protein